MEGLHIVRPTDRVEVGVEPVTGDVTVVVAHTEMGGAVRLRFGRDDHEVLDALIAGLIGGFARQQEQAPATEEARHDYRQWDRVEAARRPDVGPFVRDGQ